MSLCMLVPPINARVSVCLSSAVRVQGEKHQEEKSQPCGVCRWRESQPEEKEKSEWPFCLNLFNF